MTVAELIGALRMMPPEMTVKYVGDDPPYPIEVSTVEICTEPSAWGGAEWVRLD